jgi:prepilin signal peptidase PulO-like enzyme (type II secretory pathway)
MWDCRELILPDLLNLLIAVLGLTVAWISPLPGVDLAQSASGFAIALASAWGFYELVWWLRGEEGFGFGDVKLFAAAGTWLGPAKLTGMLLIGSLSSLIMMGLLALVSRQVHLKMALPFGPGLIVGFVAMLLGFDLPGLMFRLILGS